MEQIRTQRVIVRGGVAHTVDDDKVVVVNLDFIDGGWFDQDTLNYALNTLEEMVEHQYPEDSIAEVIDWCESHLGERPDDEDLDVFRKRVEAEKAKVFPAGTN